MKEKLDFSKRVKKKSIPHFSLNNRVDVYVGELSVES